MKIRKIQKLKYYNELKFKIYLYVQIFKSRYVAFTLIVKETTCYNMSEKNDGEVFCSLQFARSKNLAIS